MCGWRVQQTLPFIYFLWIIISLHFIKKTPVLEIDYLMACNALIPSKGDWSLTMLRCTWLASSLLFYEFYPFSNPYIYDSYLSQHSKIALTRDRPQICGVLEQRTTILLLAKCPSERSREGQRQDYVVYIVDYIVDYYIVALSARSSESSEGHFLMIKLPQHSTDLRPIPWALFECWLR